MLNISKHNLKKFVRIGFKNLKLFCEKTPQKSIPIDKTIEKFDPKILKYIRCPISKEDLVQVKNETDKIISAKTPKLVTIFLTIFRIIYLPKYNTFFLDIISGIQKILQNNRVIK